MESHKAGFPPFPHSLEIPSGLPHSHGLDDEMYVLSYPSTGIIVTARGLGLGLWLVFVLASQYLSRRRGRGNVVIPKGFPRSVGRVGSRLYGFPCFPHSVISMACFSRGWYWRNRCAAAECNLPHSERDVHRHLIACH